jgi:hypothetical protein
MGRIDGASVATVVWATHGVSRSPDGRVVSEIGPHWSVGFHAASKVPSEWIVQIEGVPFVFDQGTTSMRLDGTTLDFDHGKFLVG